MKSEFAGKLEGILGCVKNKAKIGILLVGAVIAGFNRNSIANNFNGGSLEIINIVNDPNFIINSHITKLLKEATDGYDVAYDMDYFPYLPPTKIAKIVSIIPDHELMIDARNIESLTPVNLELSLDIGTQRGALINVSNLENVLWCSFHSAGAPGFWDFGNKPVTLWERTIIDPNKSPNEPNNYALSFMADIREAIDKSDFYDNIYNLGVKTAKIPIDTLDGIYGSEIPYLCPQIRFNTFPGDLNLDGKVNLKDYAYWANCDPIADIIGVNGLPDGTVDFHDLRLFNRDYLKDSDDPNTWKDFLD